MAKVHHLPPPRDWQAFEDLCRDLFAELYNSPTTLKHGSGGESQNGVDIYGLLPDGRWFGVQCKEKEPGKQLTRAVMKAEAAKAEKFNPRLARYVFATTAKRSTEVQAWARELTGSTSFEEVIVFAWDDICEALAGSHDLIARHFAGLVPPPRAADPDPPADALDAYRTAQWGKLLVLPTLALGAGQADTELLLTEVYTSLDVEERVHFSKERTGRRLSGAGREVALEPDGPSISMPGDREYLDALVEHAARAYEKEKESRPWDPPTFRRCRALEAAAANRRLVLIGAPGSGKSTFGRFLVLSLLGAALGRPEANLAMLNRGGDEGFEPWPHGVPLPFFVELRDLVASKHFPAPGAQGEAEHLVRHLIGLCPAAGRFEKVVRDALKKPNGVLVVLDGLDETPGADETRERIRQVVAGFVRTYPTSRVLVTSRPYAYDAKSLWRLDDAGFESVELAPFDLGQQAAFVQAWYARLVQRGQLNVDADRRKALCADLVGRLRKDAYLEPLGERPLLLTMIAGLHAASGGSLPSGGRAALYTRSVELLLDRWNETRDGRKASELLGMPLPKIELALERLAFRVHRSRGVDAKLGAEIRSGELWEELSHARKDAEDPPQPVDDQRIMRYLHQRSGILIGESEEVYRFPHRSYQEFLAAGHLLREDFPELLDQVVTADPALWREVVLFAVGKQSNPPIGAWLILERLVPEDPEGELDAADPRFFRALLAALAIRENDLWQAPSKPDRPKLERVRRWLERTVELGALVPKDRAQAGQVLALLGDRRPGIGLDVDGLPYFEWVQIPAGKFTMGSERSDREKPVHEERVAAFHISRTPVTHQQYQAFVADGGYTDRWRRCWTESGWEWKKKEKRDGPFSWGGVFDLPNHPRVGVSWYEAVAFCRWLAERKGIAYRLPTEAEWERAARGTDGREYPWDEKFNGALCNSFEAGIGTTTAVGLFPGGESPAGNNGIGILDASGNVWEWCSTKWRSNYEEPADDELESSAGRVVRGGSFASGDFYARCACRYGSVPVDFSRDSGFRLVAPFEDL